MNAMPSLVNQPRKRILFVDDEPLVLQGLQRLLRGMRDGWEMEFVQSGYAALERLAQAPCDVIVSDMQMPGMNGAELLNEVMRRFPRTVRLILSGEAERALILRCVGSTHQYLAKPCDPEVLKYTIARATSLESVFQNPELMALVARIDTLPSLPSRYTDILTALQSPSISMENIGAIIEQDIAMTAKVLKIVNSAFFGLAREISSAAEAAAYLGADVLKALVLSAHMFARYEADEGSNAFAEQLWFHSLTTGIAAKALAREEEAGEAVANEAFVAGTLHDVGKLVLASSFPAEYRRVLTLVQTRGISCEEAERAVFGAAHPEIGGYLLGLWGLPVPVVEAVALHESSEASLRPGFSALTAVHIANSLARPVPKRLDPVRLAASGLSHRLTLWQSTIQNRLAAAS
jgi:HD-like signal output (HDOD) protein